MIKISVIIPVYNAEKTLGRLLESLQAQKTGKDEIILVDDCSTDKSAHVAQQYDTKLFTLPSNRGPAYCRNYGGAHASGDILVFTDSDCVTSENWLSAIRLVYENGAPDALMGKLRLNPSNYLGDSISALGFPAGGSIGFEKIWQVDRNGHTKSLSTCNCAIKKSIFQKIGGFDETFPYAGGEDSYLAYQLISKGYKIKYNPKIIAYHEARKSLISFMKWQFKRGVSSFIFSKKITNQSDFISLRFWSTRNILSHYKSDLKLPLIVILLLTSFILQLSGFFYAKRNFT